MLLLLLQFELECRPFYVAGFNAHDLVPKSLAEPVTHATEGAPPLPEPHAEAPSLFCALHAMPALTSTGT